MKALSNTIYNYNMCDYTLTDITSYNGFISSPNYPTYTQVFNECTKKIVAPFNKVIRIWISSDMTSSNSNGE